MPAKRAVLLDIDGVLTVSWRALPGAVDALDRLRKTGMAVALLTNTTSRSRASIVATLSGQGFNVGVEDVLTAPTLTAVYLQQYHPGARCFLLNSGDIREDLPGVTLVADDEDAGDVGVVVVGGAGPEFTYRALNRAFTHVQRGAALVAMHRNLSWATDQGLQLDGGAFLLGLEQATGVRAAVVGKPSAPFFTSALQRLGASAAEAVMVGDDVETDVLAAQQYGITGVLVRTGKYLPALHDEAAARADHVLDSFADVPGLMETLAGE